MEKNKTTNCVDTWINNLITTEKLENKLRYMLETFFYSEGWASKTNENVMKEGHSQQFVYNKSDIAHFIEDAVRVFRVEFNSELKKDFNRSDLLTENEKLKFVIETLTSENKELKTRLKKIQGK